MDRDGEDDRGVRDAAWVEREVRRRAALAQIEYAKANGFTVIDGRVYVTLGEASEIDSSRPMRKGI